MISALNHEDLTIFYIPMTRKWILFDFPLINRATFGKVQRQRVKIGEFKTKAAAVAYTDDEFPDRKVWVQDE